MRVRFAAALTTSLMLVTLAGDALAGDALTSCLAASEGNYSPTKHAECLHQDADQGDRLSQYMLASAYFTGKLDLPKNYAEASKWYLRAANQGLSGAQFILGAMYAKGNGVPRTSSAHLCGSIWQWHSTIPMQQKSEIALKGK
jgi:TPR repeat protein